MFEIHTTDENLIASIREDDYTSYNQLFVRYYASLCRYVYSLLKNKADAEDIVQELFLILWNNRKKLTIEENVSGYLYRMARNLALNHIRSSANYKNTLENQDPITEYYEDNHLETEEFRIALLDCIDRLPVRSREVLILHRIKGLQQKEIAEQLAISVKTIKNQLWTSLQKLRECLKIKQMIVSD